MFDGAIAQLGERLPCTQEVSGSIPLGSTIATDVELTMHGQRFERNVAPPAWFHHPSLC